MTEMPRRNFCRQFSQLTRDEQTLLFASRTLVKKGSANHTAGRCPPLPGKGAQCRPRFTSEETGVYRDKSPLRRKKNATA